MYMFCMYASEDAPLSVQLVDPVVTSTTRRFPLALHRLFLSMSFSFVCVSRSNNAMK